MFCSRYKWTLSQFQNDGEEINPPKTLSNTAADEKPWETEILTCHRQEKKYFLVYSNSEITNNVFVEPEIYNMEEHVNLKYMPKKSEIVRFLAACFLPSRG